MEEVTERRSLRSVLESISADYPVDLTEIKQIVCDAFTVFDHEGNGAIDAREIGTVMRVLGCTPAEDDVKAIIEELEEPESLGYVYLDRFLPVMIKIIHEQSFQPSSYVNLVKAFKLLDTDQKGYLTKDELINYMMEEGEPFTQEEMDEMLIAAEDKEALTIDFVEFATWLVVEDDEVIAKVKEFVRKVTEAQQLTTSKTSSGTTIKSLTRK